MSKQPEQIVAGAAGKVDEEILAAAFGSPRGSNVSAASGGMLDKVGKGYADRQAGGAAAAGIALGKPGAVAVTETSLLTMSLEMSFWGNRVKEVTEVLSRVPLAEIDSLEVGRFGLAGVMEIVAGGSSFKLEGKLDDMTAVADAFARAKVEA